MSLIDFCGSRRRFGVVKTTIPLQISPIIPNDKFPLLKSSAPKPDEQLADDLWADIKRVLISTRAFPAIYFPIYQASLADGPIARMTN